LLRLLCLFLALVTSAPVMSSTTREILDQLVTAYPERSSGRVVIVDIAAQQLHLVVNNSVRQSYDISTSKYGIGSESGSNKTPLGAHYVKRRYGHDAPRLSIFKGRKDTGEVAAVEDEARATGHDFVTTRILWLKGLEQGKNTGEGVDSYQRYIYIHGTHEEGLIGQPASHGCIRMRNSDVIELFGQTPTGSLVYIAEELTNGSLGS